MKLPEIKKAVLEALEVANTKELKKTRPDLVKGLDFRTKVAWKQIEVKITAEADIRFQQTLTEAIETNKISNQRVKHDLAEWDAFKAKVLAESEAEINGRLSYLSDYQSAKK